MSASTSPKKKAAAAPKKRTQSKLPQPKPPAISAKKKKAEWNLRLYVAGQTPKSLTAFANLKRMCEEHLADKYEIEVIDLTQQPHLAMSDQIVALPTLVRRLPAPIKRVVGDLSNSDRVLVGMDLVSAFK